MFQQSVVVAVISCLLSGCGRSAVKDEEGGSKSAEKAGKTATSPAVEEDLGPILAELTQTVRKYSAEQRRVPESLNELVTAGYLKQLPAAPAGKEFFVDKELKVGVR
jgi:hypothetical protein